MWKPSVPGSLSWQTAELHGFTAWTFDYRHEALDWVTNKAIGPALATAIGCLAQASGHKVIIVAHSMGGLAAQYAIGEPGSPAVGHVAEVITVGTPYTGSQVLSDAQEMVTGQAAADAATGDPQEAAFTEALLSACAGIATHTDTNPCFLASVLRAPVGTALEVNSPQINALPAWPAALPVLDIAGNMDLFVGVGRLGFHAHPGDIAVTLPSATAHDTTGSPYVLACSASLVSMVRQLALPSCFHSNLVNTPKVIARILAEIRRYQPNSPGGAEGSQYASSLTGFVPAAQLSKVWSLTTWDGTPSRDALTITSVRLANGELTLSYVAQHSGADTALTEGTADACIQVGDDGFWAAPTQATPGFDDAPIPGDYSGTLTFPALSPGTYVLSWGCGSLDPNYQSENITLGTATGTSVGPPQVDPLYGSYTWYVTRVRYTASTTTVTLTTIASTTLFTSPTSWALDPPDQFSPGDAWGVASQANSVVTGTYEHAGNTTGNGGYTAYLTVTFPTGRQGMYFVFKGALNNDEYIRLP